MSEVIKIQPSDPSQGDYVLIEKDDFDEKLHKVYVEPKATTVKKSEDKQDAK